MDNKRRKGFGKDILFNLRNNKNSCIFAAIIYSRYIKRGRLIYDYNLGIGMSLDFENFTGVTFKSLHYRNLQNRSSKAQEVYGKEVAATDCAVIGLWFQ